MARKGSITLFVPENSSDGAIIWRRYVITDVSAYMRRHGETFSGEMYIFDRSASAYSGAVRCDMPKIFPGCAVIEEVSQSVLTSLNSLPDGCLKVLSAERFDGGQASHIKLIIG